jgi:hypothetical protein
MITLWIKRNKDMSGMEEGRIKVSSGGGEFKYDIFDLL